MIAWLDWLAQATTSQPTSGGAETFLRSFLPLILVVGVFWWILSRGRSRERQQFEQMLGSLKRSDRVQTVGGIIGTVVDIRDDEIVLKVDETNNVKMRFAKHAIKGLVGEAGPPTAPEK
jgi:preprotein translocase subunit YajC